MPSSRSTIAHALLRATLLSSALVVCLLSMDAPGAPPPAQPASATLPLDQVLQLYRENERRNDIAPPAPPVAGVVHQLQIEARLLDDAVAGKARFSVIVLEENQWASVPLLTVSGDTRLAALPALQDAALTIEDDQLTLLTRKKGTFDFTVEFLQRAQVDGSVRRASIAYPAATVALGHLSFDSGVFGLVDHAGAPNADGVFYPSEGAFDLQWVRRAPPAATVAVPAPAIESVIPSAHASVVSTLEGTHIVRVLYRLEFAGRQSLSVDVPPGYRLERGYLNGISIPVEPDGGRLTLEVSPAQSGQQGGSLELVLFSPGNGYLLSGELALPLPTTSWRINELFLSTHLPGVFDYARAGGSLSPASRVPGVDFAYAIPTPGKRLTFHQFLVQLSQPGLTLAYDVTLEGNYFRAAQP